MQEQLLRQFSLRREFHVTASALSRSYPQQAAGRRFARAVPAGRAKASTIAPTDRGARLSRSFFMIILSRKKNRKEKFFSDSLANVAKIKRIASAQKCIRVVNCCSFNIIV
ncbi:hypothetical protein [Methylocapsa sp. S129]|uniref:hypothetical protein n=1 Tax=Methylocapsa sp. S129 TaxID=1641869 RepID=UPI001576AE19|nr:hypothetical protein [Methylocapsa sp. S129]